MWSNSARFFGLTAFASLQQLADSLEATEVQAFECQDAVELSFCFRDYQFRIQSHDWAVGCGPVLFVDKLDCPVEILLQVAGHFDDDTRCGECFLRQSKWQFPDSDVAMVHERLKTVEGAYALPTEYNGDGQSIRFAFRGLQFAVHRGWVYMSGDEAGEEQDGIGCLMQTLGIVCQ